MGLKGFQHLQGAVPKGSLSLIVMAGLVPAIQRCGVEGSVWRVRAGF
jgi:hypothetical protein